jgi:hypothetical protein
VALLAFYIKQLELLNQTGMTIIKMSSLSKLFGSLAVLVKEFDFRSMTLRRQVSLVLPFGQPVGPDHHLC